MAHDPFKSPFIERSTLARWAADAAGFTLKVLAAVLAINMIAAVLILATANAELPKPDEKPITKPPLGVELTCEPLDMTRDEAVKAGARSAIEFLKWGKDQPREQREEALMVRFWLVGFAAGVTEEAGFTDQHKAFLVGYAMVLNRAFGGDIPDRLMKSYKKGMKTGVAEAREKDFECTGV